MLESVTTRVGKTFASNQRSASAGSHFVLAVSLTACPKCVLGVFFLR